MLQRNDLSKCGLSRLEEAASELVENEFGWYEIAINLVLGDECDILKFNCHSLSESFPKLIECRRRIQDVDSAKRETIREIICEPLNNVNVDFIAVRKCCRVDQNVDFATKR